MALLEELFEFEGVGGPLALGLGALLLAPKVLPAVGRILRPVTKEVIKAGIMAYDEARATVSDAYEATGDLVKEARSERDQQREGRRSAEASPKGRQAGHEALGGHAAAH